MTMEIKMKINAKKGSKSLMTFSIRHHNITDNCADFSYLTRTKTCMCWFLSFLLRVSFILTLCLQLRFALAKLELLVQRFFAVFVKLPFFIPHLAAFFSQRLRHLLARRQEPLHSRDLNCLVPITTIRGTFLCACERIYKFHRS